jgi:hypothetical protein
MKTQSPRKARSAIRVTEGAGNVFADLGLANAEQELLKAQLALQIYCIIKRRGLTEVQAADALGIKAAASLPSYAKSGRDIFGWPPDRLPCLAWPGGENYRPANA